MATWGQTIFQNRSSPIIEQFIFLHDHIMSILILIIFIVAYLLVILYQRKFLINIQKENHNLEILWTFLPGAVLILIAIPSLRLLYLSEETENLPISIKAIGHQWFWSYEYGGVLSADFDSYMSRDTDNKLFRTLDTDSHLTMPTKTPIQIFISSTDVLHAWTLPSLGVKADSTPGRLNIILINFIKPGSYFGQCSEICGTNHSFIPIVVNAYPLNIYKTWLKNFMLLKSLKPWIFTSAMCKNFTL